MALVPAVRNLAGVGTDSHLPKALTRPYVGPFPDFPRPSADECRGVKAALEALHGPVERIKDARTDPSIKQVQAPQTLKVEGEEIQHLVSGSGVSKDQLQDGLKMLTHGNQEHGCPKRVKEEADDASHAEDAGRLAMDNLDSGLRTPEVKSSKRLKVSLSVPAVLGSSNAGIKREAENFDFESGASPPFELNNEHIKISAQPVKELRPSAARSHGLREAKEEPADYTAGLNVAASLPLYAPNSNQAPQRLLRSQTKASQKESIKEETPSKVSTDIDQRKPAGSRKRNFQNVQEEPLQTVAPVTPQPQVLNGRGSASQPAVKMELSLAKQTSSSFPQASKLPLTQTSASLQITQAQPPGETAGHSSVLDSLVRTILSQNTTDTNSKRAFASLKQAFPTWEDVRAAGPGPLAASIKSGGLAEIKARRILDILEHLASKYGALELEHLRSMSDEQVKAELSQFKGVGPKTVACVLMFCLDRNEFPVDTHVWRISKRLGWVPQTADREATYLHLNQRVPDDVKYDLHCLLVGHGKKCPGCAKGGRPQKAPDGPCPLTPWIRGAGKGDKK